ncbi:hypothetical protein PybrP1_012733, partial [[Pythium] brassicae (nom. inval.)]
MACTCGLLPCICVRTTVTREELPAAKLRRLFAADATAQCAMCMLLPCICPAEDEDEAGGDEETTSVEAASPASFRDDEDEPAEPEDAFGRVRLAATSDVWVARELKRALKPHQAAGVEFLQRHIAADRGCILADYMGLGKTLQVLTVIYSYVIDQTARRRAAPATALVLCPAICIPNWEAEFAKWLSAGARARCPVLALDPGTSKSAVGARVRLLQRWKRDGGVLLLGYEMFRSLLNPTLPAAADRDAAIQVCTRVGDSTMEVTDPVAATAQRSAREFHRLLCEPGADLVVLDEGHRMKDPTSLLCQSVAKVQSLRRLVLTGYPVQNSLSEYWCMVNFARAGFLGSYDEFRSQFEKPIVDGDAARSKELIAKLQDVVLRRGQSLLKQQLPPKKEWILYCKLSPIQHRLYCDFLAFYGDDGKAAADLLSAYAALLQVMNHPDIIRWKLHPEGGDEGDDGGDEDADSAQVGGWNDGWNWEPEEKLAEKRLLAVEQSRKRKQKISDRQKSFEWARPVFAAAAAVSLEDDDATDRPRKRSTSGLQKLPHEQQLPGRRDMAAAYETMVLENSGKMVMLMQIIEESFACGDKVVVFSQSVPTLKIIGAFLRASAFSPSRRSESASAPVDAKPRASTASGKRRAPLGRPNRDPAGIQRKRKSWHSALNKKAVSGGAGGKLAAGNATAKLADDWFLQIDGSTAGVKRMEYIETFSSKNSAVKLLLVSTRAGAEGINLHAANRLVLFDVSWNPSHDHQSMCRSHRIGQAKTVHVYRLVSTGTMERMIYEQQMKKVDLSTSVVDNHEPQSDGFRAEAAAAHPEASGESEAVIPFSGFLQPPSEHEYDKQVCIDEALLEDDPVLVACVQKSAHWLVRLWSWVRLARAWEEFVGLWTDRTSDCDCFMAPWCVQVDVRAVHEPTQRSTACLRTADSH